MLLIAATLIFFALLFFCFDFDADFFFHYFALFFAISFIYASSLLIISLSLAC